MSMGAYTGMLANVGTYCRTGPQWDAAYVGGSLLYMILIAASFLFVLALSRMFKDPLYRQGRLVLAYLCFILVELGSCVHVMTTSRPGFFRGLGIDSGIFVLAFLLCLAAKKEH